MPACSRETAILHTHIRRTHRVDPEQVRVERRPLRGGLEAADVERLTVRYRAAQGRERAVAVVVKRLAGATVREAAIYERFVAPRADALAPRLHAVDRDGDERAVLYLEALRPVSRWPWREHRAAQRVLDRAAQLHDSVPDRDAATALTAWDYESELQHTAIATLQLLEQVRRQRALRNCGGAIRWTRQVADALPALRQQLLAYGPLGRTVIHGDLHPGNVVLRRQNGAAEPVMLDWGRTRMGSPLEDVSCWLQSLGAWEPEARRRHDRLLAGYLRARGVEPRLGPELRAAYWLAGASNALSGALLYHLSVLLDPTRTSRVRASAAYSAGEWVRVLRRAACYWR